MTGRASACSPGMEVTREQLGSLVQMGNLARETKGRLLQEAPFVLIYEGSREMRLVPMNLHASPRSSKCKDPGTGCSKRQKVRYQEKSGKQRSSQTHSWTHILLACKHFFLFFFPSSWIFLSKFQSIKATCVTKKKVFLSKRKKIIWPNKVLLR